MRDLKLAVLLLCGMCAAGCGAAVASAATTLPAPGPAVHREGQIHYEARSPTERGASSARDRRPARFVDIEARDPSGAVLVRTMTDSEGRFAIDMPATASTLVLVVHSSANGHDVAVTTDPGGLRPHVSALPVSTTGAPLTIDVHDDSLDGLSGALHILDTIIRGLDTATQWTGRPLPPLFVYWARGVTSVWSFYRGERPTGSNRFALELMGGERGRLAITDTDEHDEAIVLHELGHFVFDRWTSDSSAGGMHPSGVQIDPGLAWEEGRATWFAASVLGDPNYRDTIGIEPRGRLRVSEDIERQSHAPFGIGSEIGVSNMLWDLTDGVPGIPDVDNDGIALGPEVMLRAMIDLAAEPGAFPCLPTFLRFLVQRGITTAEPVRRALAVSHLPPTMLPDDDHSQWPIDLALPGSHSGKIDGRSDPAPSGGPPRPENGLDAVRTYRIHVESAGFLTARLTVLGTGMARDGHDLDLELRSIRADRLEVSNGESVVESVGHFVQPGWYVLMVRDGGGGNRAPYELSVNLQ